MTREVVLGEILVIERDEVTLEPGEYYRTAGIYSFGRGAFERGIVQGADTSYQSLFRLHEDQVVLSRLNGWEGAVDVVDGRLAGCFVSNEYPTFAVDRSRADPAFLRWIVRWPTFWDRLVPRGSMVRRKRVQPAQFLKVPIPLPPIAEQFRIAERLDCISDRVIGRATPLVSDSEAMLEGLVECLLKDMADDLRHRTKECAALGDLGRWSSGGTPSAKERTYFGGDIPWAVIGDLNDDVVETTARAITDLGLTNSSAKIIPAGSLMVAMYGSIGKLGVAGVEMATNQAIACCQPDPDLVSSPYLATFLRCVRTDLVQLGQGGAQRNISQTLLKAVSVPVPSRESQLDFASKVHGCLARFERARALCERRRALLRSIVPSSLNSAFASFS